MKKEYKEADITLIETKVPEEILLKAEEINDTGSISSLIKKEEGNWEGVIIDNNIHFSAQIHIKTNRLKSCRCNCTTFPREGICAHILTLIFAFRRNTSVGEKRTKTKKRKGKAKSISVANLLKELSREEIEAFILSKVRSDRNLKLLLQARFIGKLSEDQLRPFIESTFPILTKANEKVAPSKLKSFLDIVDELLNHFKILVAHEDYIEAYNLAFLLLKKSFYIKFHLRSDHDRFLKYHKNLLSNYLEIYKLIEAPEYRMFILDQLKEILNASYVTASMKIEKDLWMLYFDASDRREDLSDIVQSFLQRGISSDYNSYYFVRMLELILTDDTSSLIELIEKKDLQESYRILQFLNLYKSYDQCQKVMFYFYRYKNLNHPLAKLVVNSIEVEEGQIPDLIDSSINYFLKFKEVVYLDFIQSISRDWSTTMQQLEELLKRKRQFSLLIKYYIHSDQEMKAIEVLNQQLDLDLLKRYDTRIAAFDENACYELYYRIIENYISEHFGIHAQDFVKNAFNRIISIGYKKWVREIKLGLSKQFPERKNLFR